VASRRAIAAPIPRDAPVTIATRAFLTLFMIRFLEVVSW
jgi:hypothetical protein